MDPARKIIPFPGPSMEDRTDDELMLLARGGVDRAFDALVRRYQPFALRVAYKYLGGTAAAKDAAQNTFVEIYRAVPRYRADGKFRAYLRKVLVNQCRMIHRRRRVERTAAEAPRPGLVTDDEVIARERRRDIERAVATLSDKLRAVVVLRFAGGLSYQEIAETLDLPVGTVKSRLSAGLAKLRRTLS